MMFYEGACRKRPELWPSIWFCSIAVHQALCFQQFMAKNSALKLKCTCEGKRLQATVNVTKSVTAMPTVT
jgi:hypothetical protein